MKSSPFQLPLRISLESPDLPFSFSIVRCRPLQFCSPSPSSASVLEQRSFLALQLFMRVSLHDLARRPVYGALPASLHQNAGFPSLTPFLWQSFLLKEIPFPFSLGSGYDSQTNSFSSEISSSGTIGDRGDVSLSFSPSWVTFGSRARSSLTRFDFVCAGSFRGGTVSLPFYRPSFLIVTGLL